MLSLEDKQLLRSWNELTMLGAINPPLDPNDPGIQQMASVAKDLRSLKALLESVSPGGITSEQVKEAVKAAQREGTA